MKLLFVQVRKLVTRDQLEADVLYLDMERAQYFYTPNPPGVVWLSPEEADAMFGEETPANCIDTLEDL
jgi:hypothetical protein